MPTILIVDDDKNIRRTLARYVHDLGHTVETAANGAASLAVLERRNVDVVLSDVRMGEVDGFAVLKAIRGRRPDVRVILMTAFATVRDAVEAMRAGAFDYLVKPFGLDEVGTLLQRVLAVGTVPRAPDEVPLLESQDPVMQQALATARKVATADAAVLLCGERGTGKGMLAAAIHGWSSRRDGPFVTVPCVTTDEHVLASELFGHARGAFAAARRDKISRIEVASDGTIFLDEVADLSLGLQRKLLRFLEDGRFERLGGTDTLTADTRLVAATSRELEAEVRAGHFHQDLFFRLDAISIVLPALRDRGRDLAPLTDHLLRNLSARHRRGLLRPTAEARAAMAAYAWPGNVRELVEVLEHAVMWSSGDEIPAAALPDRVRAALRSVPDGSPDPFSLEELERRHIEQVLQHAASLDEAAACLGINPSTLWRKRKRYGIG